MARRKKSWTILETLILVFALTFIMGMLFVAIDNMILKAQVAKTVQDIYNIADAATRYYTDTGHWPDWPSTPGPGDYGAGFVFNNDHLSRWNGPYLDFWPLQPWSKQGVNANTYQWDCKDVDCDYVGDWVVEIGFADLSQSKRNYVANLIDQAIDGGDGPCAGKFRAYNGHNNANCNSKDWAGWAKYVVAQKASYDNADCEIPGNGC